MTTIHLIVSLDTECDKGPKWEVPQPLRFVNVREGVAERLQPLFEAHEIRPTYLLSPEILDDDACVDVFKTLIDRAELGTHLHAEFIKPQASPGADRTDAFQSDFAPPVEFEKLKNLTELFERRLGYRPTAFRAGRYGISRYTLGFLEELGYTVDSSVTPYAWWWRRRGEGVNFLGAPAQPYHPSRRDFRRPGGMRILEVPITLVNPFWDRFPRRVQRALNPFNRLQTVMMNTLLKRRLRCAWLRPSFSSTERMLDVTDYLACRAGSRPVVLCMMFHSNETTPGTSPYNLTAGDVDGFLDKLERYFTGLRARYDVRSIGLSETARVGA